MNAEETLSNAMEVLRRGRGAVETGRRTGAQHLLQMGRSLCSTGEHMLDEALKSPEVVELLAARSDLAAQVEELRKP
jgi:hypothetical protein